MAIVLLFLCHRVGYAHYFEKDGIYYDYLSNETVCVTNNNYNFNSYSGSVIIPSTVTYNGTSYNVTAIGSNAFQDCTDLTSVTLPNSITTIDASAFYNCTSLKSITIPESVTSINYQSFYGCTGLTEITIPSKVSQIGYSAFGYCSNVTKVTCYPSTPPSDYGYCYYILEGVNGLNIELCVPAWSISLYQSASGWNEFGSIKAIETEFENIHISSGQITFDDSSIPTNEPNVTLNAGASININGTNTFSMNSFNQSHSIAYNEYTAQYATYSSFICNNPSVRADTVQASFYYDSFQDWAFICLPFDSNLSNVTFDVEDTDMALRYYDGESRATGNSSNWKDVTSDMTINAGQGYILKLSTTATVTFTAINNTNKNRMFSANDLSCTLSDYTSEFAHNRSWNFIGNPYQCYFDISYMNYESPITYYSSNSYNEEGLMLESYTAVSPLDDKFILNPLQAFFVQKPVDIENITFCVDGRQNNAEIQSSYSRRVSDLNIKERQVFDFTLSKNDKKYDKTRVVINPHMTLGYESIRDASKFMTTGQNVAQIYTLDESSVKYAINERPLDDGNVKLGFYAGTAGTYTIALTRGSYKDGYIVLEDKVLGVETILDSDKGYTFDSKKGYDNNRFQIKFIIQPLDIDNAVAKTIKVARETGTVIVSAPEGLSINIFNMSGQIVKSRVSENNTTSIKVNAGIYIVKVADKTFKTIVKN